MTTTIMDEQEVDAIPTPNHLPEKLDLSRIPQQMLRTGAVEALANQNEDLMARLSVALRRSAGLENRIAELESEIKSLEFQAAIAQDEAMVLKEKDTVIMARFGEIEEEKNAKADQVQMLETQFAELYATAKDRQRALESEINERNDKISALQRSLSRHSRYRRRIGKVILNTRQRIATLNAHWQRAEETSRELKTRLGEAGLRIQQISKDADAHQRQLVENYERSLKEQRTQILELERQNQAFAIKTHDYQSLYEKAVVLENSLIKEQRRLQEYKATKEAEVAQFQVDLAQANAQNKSRIVALEDLHQQVAQLTTEKAQSQDSLAAFKDQVETLQLLWQEGQSQIERTNGKNQALQKLNQQMSQTVSQLRHEIQQLRGQLEAQNVTTTERIKEIKGHLQMITQPAETSQSQGLNFIESTDAQQGSRQVLSRIDTLIAEIQSGFQARGSEPAPSETAASSITSSTDAVESRGSGATSKP